GDDLFAGAQNAGALDDDQLAAGQVVGADFHAQAVVEAGLDLDALEGSLDRVAGGVGDDQDFHLFAAPHQGGGRHGQGLGRGQGQVGGAGHLRLEQADLVADLVLQVQLGAHGARDWVEGGGEESDGAEHVLSARGFLQGGDANAHRVAVRPRAQVRNI